MSFSDYPNLQLEIKSFLWDRSDVVAKIPTFIELAEAEMRRELRTQQVVVTRPLSISSSIASLPSNERQVLSIQLNWPEGNGTVDLDYATPEQLSAYSVVTPQRPRFYTIENNRLTFLPAPDREYTGTMTYRSAFEALSDSNQSNWILDRHPDMYLSGALKWAKAWLIDSEQDWATPFYTAIQAANRDTPMRQANTKLRADDASTLNRTSGQYRIYDDSYGNR